MAKRVTSNSDAQPRDEGANHKPKRDPQSRPETLNQAVRFLDARLSVEKLRPTQVDPAQAFDLDRMRALLNALGDPQNNFRTVHVAGSKGKGSVCEMLASILTNCRCTVGLYTSPHLVDIRERIRLQGEMIDEATFVRLLNGVADAAEPLARKFGEVTAFEFLTAIAFSHFSEQAVDLGVIEVGMGGTLDATNVISPAVTVIAAIQKEHTQLLGTTLTAIASAKAGIMKPGVPCYTMPQPDEVMAVFEAKAAAVGAPLRVLGKNVDFSFRIEAAPGRGLHSKVCLSGQKSSFEHLVVPLNGEHQAYNCGLALGVVDALRDGGLQCPDALVAEGLRKTPSNGRLERICESPQIYIDGAHNPESVQAVVKSVAGHLRPDSLVVVFGCASDKDIPRMLAGIAAGADKVIFTRAEGSERAVDPRELQRKFAEISPRMSQIGLTLPDALKLARRAVNRGDIILVTGSFLLAGQAKRVIAKELGLLPVKEVKPARAAAPAEEGAKGPYSVSTPPTPGKTGLP